MINTRLFIGRKEVDLDKGTQFTINKTFKNLSNPTDIINDWTKTIVLPFTANNNRIFGEIYNEDRSVVGSSNEDDIVGIYFDPSKKIDFVLTADGALIMNGYMKMSSIEADKGYSINLFGQIGKVFSELKKVTPILTETITEDKYLFDPLKHDDGTTGFYMTKDEVYKSWNTIRHKQSVDPLISTIGFCPYSGMNSDFQNDQIQLTTYPAGEQEMMSFKDILTNNDKYTESVYSPDAIVGKGLLPRQIGDFRSYYQYPYMFVDKMFDILQYKTHELTGYSLILDNSWFNSGNIYYNNMVMLLKQLEHNNVDQQTYAGFAKYDVNDNVYWNDLHPDTQYSINVELDSIEDVVDNNEIIINDGTVQIKYDLKLGLKFYPGIVKFLTIHPRTRLLIHVKFVDAVDNTIFDVDEFNVFGKTTTIDTTKYRNAIKMDAWFGKKRDEDGSGNYRNDYVVDLVGNKTLKEYKFKHNVKIEVELKFLGDMDLIAFYQTEDAQRIHEGFLNSQEKLFPYISNSSIINYVVSKGDKRSFDKIYFNDLWNNDYSLFDQCIKYTKMYNLIWDLDDINKTITVLPMYKYFANTPEIEDWTNKIDFKKEYKIEPLIYDSKYYKLGYEDSDTGIGQDYLKRHGSNFGDMLVNTKYNFNEDTNMLIEGLKAPIIFTQTVLDWNNIYSQKVVYTNTQEPMVVLLDKDNNAVDMFGTFLLYRGLKYFNDDLRNTALSDDTQDMQDIQKYMYIETSSSGGGLVVDRYPYLDICYDYDGTSLGATFGTPMTRFDSSLDYSHYHPIYDIIWKGFMNEYTNIQNHKITAYAKMSLYDISNFRHSRLVKIKNLIYLVNKIIDYSFDSMTKVELIKVYNVDNYRNVETPFIIPLYARSDQSSIYIEGDQQLFNLIIYTNIGHFSRYNILINYAETGLQLPIFRITKLETNKYSIIFSHLQEQELRYHAYINIVDDDNEALLTIPVEVNASGQDDDTIESAGFQFMDSVLNVNDLTSNLLLTFKTSMTIDQRNIQFQIKNGDGYLQIASFRLINPNEGLYAVVISQHDFNSSGGNGNIKVYSAARMIGRIAWRITDNEVGPYIELTPEYAVIQNTQTGQILNFTMETNENWTITDMNNINFITPNITEGGPGTYNFQVGVITGRPLVGRAGASVSFETEIGLQKDFVILIIEQSRS